MSVAVFVGCDTANLAHRIHSGVGVPVGGGDGIVRGGHDRKGHVCQGSNLVVPCTSERNPPFLPLENRELDLMLVCSV